MVAISPIMGGAGFRFDYRDYQRDMAKLFGVKNIALMRKVVKKTTSDATREVVKIAKDIVADEVSDSGRLAAGLGYYEPGYLRRKSSGSTPSDAHWHEYTQGNKFIVEWGTNVPYAPGIFFGFTVAEERVIYLAAEDRFITIHPFSFLGIHAMDRAQAEFESNPEKLKRIFRNNMRVMSRAWRV